jgi:predicted ATPase
VSCSAGSPCAAVVCAFTVAGLSAARIEPHLAAGRVRVDGEPVTDPDYLAAKPAVITLAVDRAAP